MYPAPIKRPTFANPIYDRHARLFGNVGQEILASLKVGVIGLGGGGSLLNEWLARLGVGHIVAVDFDKVEVSNLPLLLEQPNVMRRRSCLGANLPCSER